MHFQYLKTFAEVKTLFCIQSEAFLVSWNGMDWYDREVVTPGRTDTFVLRKLRFILSWLYSREYYDVHP